MSFLSGILNYGKKAVKFLGGNSIGATLAKTALLGFAVNKLSKNAIKDNNRDANSAANIDKGVRLQVPPAAENKIPVLYGEAYFGGIITDAELTSDNRTMYYCLTLCEKTGTDLGGTASSYNFRDVYWDDNRIVFDTDGITVSYTVDREGNIDRSLANQVRIYCYAGNSSSGIVPDGYINASYPDAHSIMPGWASATHPMTNLVFAIVRVDYNRDKGVTGLGNLTFQVANSLKNPGDVLYDYLTNGIYGANISPTDLDGSLSTLKTFSNTSVTYEDETGGVGQTLTNRYQINGLLDTSETVNSNIEKICNACASWLSYDIHEGLWGVIINRTDTSSASFSDSNILGNISIQGTGLENLYNEVKVEFPHRDIRDTADFVTAEIPSADRNSNEYDNTLNLAYDIINEPVQAELLGFIELKQSRVDLMIRFETDYSFINLRAGDVIDITNSRTGWTSKLFRIISISERQDDVGALRMEINALEYDANVYSTADLFRYTRTNSTGIVTIGSIGVPGTPQVTKFERDTRPRILVETTAPTGVVEGIEYWITYDTTEPVDDNRSYSLLATKRPVGGGVFNSGDAVNLEYDALEESDFLIKTRGFNNITVGPYSTVSGLVEFVPEQVTDVISPDTFAVDSTGGLLTALALVDLLKGVDGLFGGEAGAGSIFEKIFDIFEDETGVDILGDAAGGSLVVSSNLEIKADDVSVSSTTASINFTNGLTASGTTNVTAGLVEGTNDKDVLAWNATDGEWQLLSAANCLSGCDFQTPVVPPTPVVCQLYETTTLPNAPTKRGLDCSLTGNLVPNTGSYFITYLSNTNTIYEDITKSGSGFVYLYQTDGVLLESVASNDLIIHGNIVEIPFTAQRELGTDYYILIDEGVVEHCGCPNQEINDPNTWYFTVAPYVVDAYQVPSYTLATFTPPAFTPLTYTASPTGTVCKTGQELKLTFGETVIKGTGTVVIRNHTTGATITSKNVSSATLEDKIETDAFGVETTTADAILNFGTLTLNNDTVYRLSVPAGIASTQRGSCEPVSIEVENKADTFIFTVAPALAITSYQLCSDPFSNDTNKEKVNILSNIKINFNRNIDIKDVAPAELHIYEADGSLHQTIDLRDTFTAQRVGWLHNFSNNVNADRGDWAAGTTYQIGDIVLYDSNQYVATTVSTGAVPDSSPSDWNLSNPSFNYLIINPTRIFRPGTGYYINIDSAVIKDLECQEDFAGVSDTTTLAWETDAPDTHQLPTYDARTQPPIEDVGLEFQFNRVVEPGNGKLIVRDANGNVVAQIDSNDPAITYSS